jgi:hypothetical protein
VFDSRQLHLLNFFVLVLLSSEFRYYLLRIADVFDVRPSDIGHDRLINAFLISLGFFCNTAALSGQLEIIAHVM